MTETIPAKLFRSAAEALASNDNRKMFEMSFKGIDGTVYVIANTEHQARLAMLSNVVTVTKVNAAARSRLTAAAFAAMYAANNPPQPTLPGMSPEPPTENVDAPTDPSPARHGDKEGALDARSSPDEQVAAV